MSNFWIDHLKNKYCKTESDEHLCEAAVAATCKMLFETFEKIAIKPYTISSEAGKVISMNEIAQVMIDAGVNLKFSDKYNVDSPIQNFIDKALSDPAPFEEFARHTETQAKQKRKIVDTVDTDPTFDKSTPTVIGLVRVKTPEEIEQQRKERQEAIDKLDKIARESRMNQLRSWAKAKNIILG